MLSNKIRNNKETIKEIIIIFNSKKVDSGNLKYEVIIEKIYKAISFVAVLNILVTNNLILSCSLNFLIYKLVFFNVSIKDNEVINKPINTNGVKFKDKIILKVFLINNSKYDIHYPFLILSSIVLYLEL